MRGKSGVKVTLKRIQPRIIQQKPCFFESKKLQKIFLSCSSLHRIRKKRYSLYTENVLSKQKQYWWKHLTRYGSPRVSNRTPDVQTESIKETRFTAQPTPLPR